jgi:hypothetical protein
MAASAVTTTQMAGLYKEAYPSGIITLAPEGAKIYKALGEISATEKTGNKYHQPVVLQHEAGVSYGGGGLAGTAYSLIGGQTMTMADAQLEGSEITVQSLVAMRVLSKATGNAKAFKAGMRPIFESNMRTHVVRKEIETLYGRSATGLGSFGSGVATSGTVETMTCSAASWAIGLWAGNEGAKVNFFNASGGALISTGADAIFTITSVDPDNRAIAFTGTTTGCTALHTVAGSGTVYPDFAGARTALATYQSAEGLDYVSTVASGTTVWNISNASTLWKPNTYSASSGKLTLGKVLAAVNKGVAKGGLDEEVDLYCNPDSWVDLADSFSASRVLDSSYGSGEGKNGVEKVVYFGANGKINVTPHSMVKAGEAFVVPLARCKKVGSTDVTMSVPGRGDELFVMSTDINGVEFRTYSDWQFFCEKPALITKITSIVNG